MKILYITQTFPPEPGATSRPLSQSKYLQKLGCQVTILTTMPNYPLGKIYKEYSGEIFKKEFVEGIKTLRIWSVPAPNKGKMNRIISHLSFGLLAGIVGLFLKKHDIVIASVPNIGTEFSGMLISKFRGSVSVLEQRDMIPDNLKLIGIAPNSFLTRFLGKYYNFINRKSNVIVVPGKSMMHCLAERGIDYNKIIYLPHGAEMSQECNFEKQAYLKEEYQLQRKFIVVYSGSFSEYYDVLNYLRAASVLKEITNDIIFLLIGQGPDYKKATQLKDDLKLSNLVLTGSFDHSTVADFHGIADIFLTTCILKVETPAYLHDQVYTKTAEYFMAGKPVIAVEDGKIVGGIIQANDLGAVVPPANPIALAKKIFEYYKDQDLCARQGAAAKAYAIENHNRETVVKSFYNQLLLRFRATQKEYEKAE